MQEVTEVFLLGAKRACGVVYSVTNNLQQILRARHGGVSVNSSRYRSVAPRRLSTPPKTDDSVSGWPSMRATP